MALGLGSISRLEERVRVDVGHQARWFRLRAYSVVEQLRTIARQEQARKELLEKPLQLSEALELWAQAQLEEACTMLADGQREITVEEFWSLDLGDFIAAQEVQDRLNRDVMSPSSSDQEPSGEPPSTDELVKSWLELGATLSRARMAPDPHTPLNQWSVQQCLRTYPLACRELWREAAFRVRLPGGDPGNEPDFWDEKKQQISAERQAFIDRDFEEMKRRYREKNLTPDGRKFPGTL